MTTQEMLAKRHDIKLRFMQPWPAMFKEGIETEAHVEITMTVNDAVNVQRQVQFNADSNKKWTDEDLLDGFIAVNWASPVE